MMKAASLFSKSAASSPARSVSPVSSGASDEPGGRTTVKKKHRRPEQGNGNCWNCYSDASLLLLI